MKHSAILLLLAVLTAFAWTGCRKDGTVPEEDEVMSDPETMETIRPKTLPRARDGIRTRGPYLGKVMLHH